MKKGGRAEESGRRERARERGGGGGGRGGGRLGGERKQRDGESGGAISAL